MISSLTEAFDKNLLVHPLENVNSVDIYRSLYARYGLDVSPSAHSADADNLLSPVKDKRNTIFMLLDGFGTMLLPHVPEGGFFQTHLQGRFHSV